MRSLSGVIIFPARRIVFGIRGENKQHVERQPQRVALNLNIALLHDVEEANLNFSREVLAVR